MIGHIGGNAALLQEGAQRFICFHCVLVVGHDGDLIAEDFAELLIHDVVDRIAQAEARQHQRAAARHADDRHEQALFIAEQVAACHLAGERQPLPHKRNALQQNALARRGRLGPHQLRRTGAERAVARPHRRQQDAAHRHRRDQQRKVGTERRFHRRQCVHHAVGGIDHRGEQAEAHDEAQRAADQRRRQAVQQVFAQNLPVREAERLERADLRAPLLHKARHRGQRHQQRDREEEHREHPAKRRNLLHIVAVVGVAHRIVPRAHQPRAGFQRVQRLRGRGCLLLQVIQPHGFRAPRSNCRLYIGAYRLPRLRERFSHGRVVQRFGDRRVLPRPRCRVQHQLLANLRHLFQRVHQLVCRRKLRFARLAQLLRAKRRARLAQRFQRRGHIFNALVVCVRKRIQLRRAAHGQEYVGIKIQL